MVVERLGESAYLLRELGGSAYQIAAAIEGQRLNGVVEAVASYETVGLFVDPEVFDPSLFDHLNLMGADAPGRIHLVPVWYEEGPDLEEAATLLGLSSDHLVQLHTSETYRCFAVGFCPGFAYLGYLPNGIDKLPRRSTPRVRIEPGSVAITGRQTAVYPLPRPGGWWLIGKTPLTLVDPDDDYFPIRAGDEVRYHPIDRSEYSRRLGERL